MKIGDMIKTPRFLTVKIDRIFENSMEAYKEGFREPTYYYDDPEYDVFGKSIDMYHVIFAGVKKQ